MSDQIDIKSTVSIAILKSIKSYELHHRGYESIETMRSSDLPCQLKAFSSKQRSSLVALSKDLHPWLLT